jgi:heme/copper-type cytochrome/quinol oxidase subunit 4
MGFIMLILTGVVIGAVCGYYLYMAAKREKRSPLVWGIFGFLFSVIALVAFRITVGPIVKTY